MMVNIPLTEDVRMYLHYCEKAVNPGDEPVEGLFLEQGKKCPCCGERMKKREE